MSKISKILFPLFLSLASATSASAASLQIAPVSVEIAPPGQSGQLNLRNESGQPLSAQLRVYRWRQVNGEEILEPTNDVVASPPAVTMSPRANYAVRVVRVNRAAVGGEENYRLIIDELPDPARQRSGAVNLVLRYSVPIFFPGPASPAPSLTWSVERRNGRLAVTATNAGDRRLRIAALRIRDNKGSSVSFGAGLAGYVLGRSTMRWVAPGRTSGFAASGSASVSAQSDLGPIDATAAIKN